MTTRHRPYDPPRGAYADAPRSTYTGVDAASALDLLDCDPKSLLFTGGQGDWPRTGERRDSAAKLARELYKEAVDSKAQQGADLTDLLDLNAPSPSAASGLGLSSMAFEAGTPGVLWPGDSVLARYGPEGSFYHARVVRVYSSRGLSLADVEWLRPQAGSPRSREYAWSRGLDETLHRNGLEVSTDIRRQGAAVSATAAISPPPKQSQGPLVPLQPPSSQPAVPVRAAPVASAGVDLLDLLDLDGPFTSSAEVDLLSLPMTTPMSAAFAGGAMSNMASISIAHSQPPWPSPSTSGYAASLSGPQGFHSPSPAPLVQFTSTAAPPAEGFDFVSDMISKATESGGK